ncbi:putative ankyrin repeat protein RF_0381 [Leptopilina heterotoma]|uniref:putative ankyrin repeat protein RF_0381 n=1 Tax=Leptopilina heterotoma TaxID=63436 RepID=UPI001CA7E002|nr:putative ankyrin repeat protein RF_0381 [Leptopilina heterotoma]
MPLDICESLMKFCRLGDVEAVKHFLSHYKLSDYQKLSYGYLPTYEALNNNNTQVVKLLIDNEAKINFPEETPAKSLLHLAVTKNNFEIVEILLKKNVKVNNLNKKKQTPLHIAINQKNEEIVQLLLDNGADIELTDRYDCTPLHLAIKNGNIKIVENLLNYKADIHSNYDEKTMLHIAIENDRIEIAKLLIENGVIDKINSTAYYSLLIFLVSMCNHKILILLLENQKAKTLMFDLFSKNTESENLNELLKLAIVGGKIEIVEVLLNYNFDINAKDKCGKMTMYYAYDKNNLNICKCLLTKGFFINSKIYENFTILHMSVKNNDEEFTEYLLDNGADVNVTTNDGSTALHLACQIRSEKIVKLLLKHKIDVHVQNKFGFTCLHEAARKNNEKILKHLLRKGANINTLDNNNMTAICHAVEFSNRNVVEVLLGKKPNLEDKSNKIAFYLSILGATAEHRLITELFLFNRFSIKEETFESIHIPEILYSSYKKEYGKKEYKTIFTQLFQCEPSVTAFFKYQILFSAVEKGYVEIVQDLLSTEANVNVLLEKNSTLLEIAVNNGQCRIMHQLLKLGADLHTRDTHGNTLLHISVLTDCIAIIEFLLKHNSVEARNNKGQTPLYLSIYRNNVKVVKLILKSGVDINSKTNLETTPLHIAAKIGNLNVVKLLLDYDASVNVKDLNNQTPLDIAICSERSEIISILLLHNALSNRDDLSLKDEVRNKLTKHSLMHNELYECRKNSEPLKGFSFMCKEEIKRMQLCQLENNITLLDLVRKTATTVEIYMRNEKILRRLNDFQSSFPIYSSMLNVKINKAKQRRELIKSASLCMENVLKIEIPYLVIEKIFFYLDNLNLRNLINASYCH